MAKKNINLLLLVCLILIGISTRFFFLIDGESILPNFSAIGAIAIFGACYFKGVSKWIIPLVILWFSDIILNNVFYSQYYDSFQFFGSTWVYGSFILCGLIAYAIMKSPTWTKLFGASLVTGLVFFIITNFGVWLSDTLYPDTFAGLIACYKAGIPFFRNTLIGNVFYSFVLFGIYEFILAPTLELKEFRLIRKA